MSDLWHKGWHYDRFIAQIMALCQIYGAKNYVMTDLWRKAWHYSKFMAQRLALWQIYTAKCGVMSVL
jgi:hypothetical protein